MMEARISCRDEAGHNLSPGSVASLFDMLRFHAASFVDLMTQLEGMRCAVDEGRNRRISPEKRGLSDDFREMIAHQLSGLQAVMSGAGLPLSTELARRMENRVRFIPTQDERLWQDILALRERVTDELSATHFMVVSQHQDLLKPGANFGEAVECAFPSAAYDIEEACKCFALERHTACVMHLMRALEIGLYALVAAVGGVPATSWHSDLRGIEDAITARNKNPPPGWKADQPFVSEAASHLRLLKNAWRNQAMHAKDIYTSERAEIIFTSVKSFMQHLATRLSESQAPTLDLAASPEPL